MIFVEAIDVALGKSGWNIMRQHTLHRAPRSILEAFGRFARDERGATAVEYALLASLIGVAIIGATQGLGRKVVQVFNAATSNMNTATQ